MNPNMNHLLIVPVDGSRVALRSLDYLHRLYGTRAPLKIALVHILPALPPVLVEESKRNRRTAKQLKMIEEKNTALGRSLLEEARRFLFQKGFGPERFDTLCEKKKIGIARDINACVEARLADALVVSSSGKGRLQSFFMGEVANKLVEIVHICPVWVIKGDVTHTSVLIAMDDSPYGLRCVDHAGMMLSATHSNIILFHTQKSVSRFFPREVFEGAEDIEKAWLQQDGTSIEPIMAKAKELLIQAGIDKSRIETRIVAGSRKPARDILQAARNAGAGAIVMGRRGATDVNNYVMGSITRKVLNEAQDMAVWIVS